MSDAFTNAMLWPQPLVEFTIRAKESGWIELARALVDFGEVHLIKEGEGFRPNSKLSERLRRLANAREVLSSALGEFGVRALSPMLHEEQAYELFMKIWERAFSEDYIRELCERAHRIAGELNKVEKNLSPVFLRTLSEMLKDIDVEAVKKARYFTLIVGIGPSGLWERISKELPIVEGSVRLISYAETEREIVCVLTLASEAHKVRSLLRKEGFIEVNIDVIQAPQVLLEVTRTEAFLKALVEVASHFKVENGDLVVKGYVAKSDVEKLRAHVQNTVKDLLEFEVKAPAENAPTKPRPAPVLERLRGFAWARGVPPYWSLDPTPFMMALFVVMYGFMFGDLGLGAVITALGFMLFKSKKPFLGFHPKSVSDLGVLLMLCGMLSTVFGWLYGVAFLIRVVEHPIMSPLHDMWGIIGIALLFGAVQLVVAMLLNVINHVKAGDYSTAVFSGRGVLGMVYYVAGVYLGYVIATNEFRYQVLLQPPHIVAFATLLLAMLGVPVASVLVKGRSPMEGVIEIVEMLIEYPANTLSYMRLAIFAIAHEIFASVAEMLGGLTNPVVGYLVANFLVLAVEGFAAGIQALRLTYYEFASKLTEEEGVPFTSIRKILYNYMRELPRW